MLGVSITFVIP